MIISRSPLRISLGGGGTDLPSYYREHEGFLIAGAIDKYVYITINKMFKPNIFLRYSNIEQVDKIDEINHPIIRESLQMLCPDQSRLEITSMADIPAGTGLGSSSSFTTALLKGLHTYMKDPISKRVLAEEACEVELGRLKEPIGKQDQYIAAYGGINAFTFHKDDTVTVEPLKLSEETMYNLEDNLLLFFTGYSRSASSILKEQDDKSKDHNQDMIDNLHFVKELGYQSKMALAQGDLIKFGEIMNVHWEHKQKRSNSMSNDRINDWYNLAMKNGAAGGKLIGAGGGGFLMFYAKDKPKLRHTMISAGMQEVRFRFDEEGSKVVSY